MKSPFYKTGNSKSPLFKHHTVKARRSMTQDESNKDEYKRRSYQLNLKPTDTMFSSTSSNVSKLKSQRYKIEGNEKFEPRTDQTLDKKSGKTTYHNIVSKNK